MISRQAAIGTLGAMALLGLMCARPVHAQLVQHAPTCPCGTTYPTFRMFGGVNLGPIGESSVRALTRELTGEPNAEPGFFFREDGLLDPHWAIGVDFAFSPEGRRPLRPYAADGGAFVEGLMFDGLLMLRRLIWIAPRRVQLELSGGAGINLRAVFDGQFPLTDEDGSTRLAGVPDSQGWGPMAQLGVGATFWLGPSYAVLIELRGVARQSNIVVEDPDRGDYLLQIDDLHALLMIGFGGVLGGP